MILVIFLIFIANAFVVYAAWNDGINNAMSGISDWMDNASRSAATTFGGVFSKIVIIAILSGPIIFSIWVAGREGNIIEKWILSALTLLVMFYVGMALTNIKDSYIYSWLISTAVILKNGFITNKEAGDKFMNWIAFGTVSMFLAPFNSLLTTGAKMPDPSLGIGALLSSPLLWILFGVAVGFGDVTLREMGIKGIGGFIGKTISEGIENARKKDEYYAEKGKKDSKDIEEKTENEKKENEKAANALDSAEKALNNNDEAAVTRATNNLAAHVANAQGIVYAYPAADPNVYEVMKKLADQNELLIHNLLEKSESKSYFETKIGKAHAYLFELYKQMREEMKEGKWPRFLKLKESNFKEVIENLMATKIPYLERCANILEKRANRTSIKTFADMLENWIVELNGRRKKAIKKLNKEFKNAEKSGRETEKIYSDVGNAYREISKNEEVLKNYDAKVREIYSEILKLKDQINNSSIPKEKRIELIHDLKKRMKWVITYLSDRKKYMAYFAKEFERAEKSIKKAKTALLANSIAVCRATDTYKKISPEELAGIMKKKIINPMVGVKNT